VKGQNVVKKLSDFCYVAPQLGPSCFPLLLVRVQFDSPGPSGPFSDLACQTFFGFEFYFPLSGLFRIRFRLRSLLSIAAPPPPASQTFSSSGHVPACPLGTERLITKRSYSPICSLHFPPLCDIGSETPPHVQRPQFLFFLFFRRCLSLFQSFPTPCGSNFCSPYFLLLLCVFSRVSLPVLPQTMDPPSGPPPFCPKTQAPPVMGLLLYRYPPLCSYRQTSILKLG